ncbi:MAG TPA: DUF2207 domain-containing protein [Candidatus Saccharimonadales bacterium]|nr:DUF2207 domain-containing protein [Candidatus Saccharimonadales bacterium]
MTRVALLFAAVAALLVIARPLPASAQVSDFTITKFSADYTLTNTDRQGQLVVTENIDVDFPHYNHGILRAIPNSYKKHRLQISNIQVSSPSKTPSQSTTYQQNGNTVLKIGDPNRVITGRQQYTIRYTVRNVIGFYNDRDELYWDINGDQWGQPTEEVTLALHLPTGAVQGAEPRCFAGGGYGSTLSQCHIMQSNNVLSVRTRRPLQPYQTLSVIVDFKKGYFAPSTWYETLGEYAWSTAALLAPIVILGGIAGRTWYLKGRDEKGRGVIVPQYDAPDGLSPIEVGTLVDFKTDNKDITATIIGLAIKRFITIIETKQERKLLKDTTMYSLRLENPDITALSAYEQQLLHTLFSDFTKGSEVDVSALKYKFAATADKLRKDVRSDLTTSGYFRGKLGFGWVGKRVLWAVLALGVVGIVFLFANQASTFMLGTLVGSVIAALFIFLMPARTAKGTAAREHILGLKLYLKTAEADRLKKLQAPDAPYAPAAEPKHTVQLFEKLLPYAMALGVEGQWAKKFDDIYRTPPDWYSGNWTAFNAGYLASSLNSGVGAAVGTAFSSPSSSSGGGFSGGGGGGGGGGGW